MAFPQPFLDALIDRNPIDEVVGQYVSLTRRGSNLFGLCPFHSEKTASFSVAPDKGIYYCFGCHAGGGVVNFIMQIEGLDFPDAVRFLAKRAGMEVPEDEAYHSQYQKQERLWALCKDAARFFRQQLFSPVGKPAQAYIQKRALSMDTVKRFGLGFSPDAWATLTDTMKEKGYRLDELIDAGLSIRGKNGGVYDRFRNRLMFPIIDIRGNVIGFGGRVMDDSTPKYLNSPETLIFNKRKNLFALNVARKSKQGRIILTEGYMDAIALHQYGFDCAVASLGTSLTEDHANILAKYTNQVILTYDGDEAGQNATRRAIHYDNLRSATAEEGLICMLLREPELIAGVKLPAEACSVDLFGRVLTQLRQRVQSGRPVSLAAMEGEFTPEEMSHLSYILSKDTSPVSDEALADYLRVIQEEYEGRTRARSEDSLRLLAEQMKSTKQYGG